MVIRCEWRSSSIIKKCVDTARHYLLAKGETTQHYTSHTKELIGLHPNPSHQTTPPSTRTDKRTNQTNVKIFLWSP
jgi:hypothetical protein